MYTMSGSLSNWFDDSDFGDSDDLFSILESLEGVVGTSYNLTEQAPPPPEGRGGSGGSSGSGSGSGSELTRSYKRAAWNSSPSPTAFHHQELLSETEEGFGLVSPKGSNKRQKMMEPPPGDGGGPNCRISHITVERNRRKQMNEHLTVLRSLMPCFYVKRGDQASIIGGVVDYITELQQILQSLESKKQRKAYSDVLSPRINSVTSPRPLLLPLSPRKPPISPRINVPISPRTPQPGSPYPRPKPPPLLPPTLASTGYSYSPTSAVMDLSPSSSSTTATSIINDDLTASSRSAVAEVEVRFSGANLVLKTKSFRFPGQVMKIVAALEELSLEILQVHVNTVEETMLNSFTIKIGIECRLSAEELAQQIQQTFCLPPS